MSGKVICVPKSTCVLSLGILIAVFLVPEVTPPIKTLEFVSSKLNFAKASFCGPFLLLTNALFD